MRKLVILRPEPAASATFERAVEQGLSPLKLPLFEIERLQWSPPLDLSAFDGMLVSSANAIREAGPDIGALKSLPVYAVGPATANAAREAGFEVARTGVAGIGRLLKAIDPDLRLLHLAGDDLIDLRLVWQKILVVPVYRSRMIERVDPAPVHGAVAMVHSPRAGARLAELVGDRSATTIAAISEAAALACGEGWQEVAFIERPGDPGLLALAARLCEKTGG